MRIAIISDIHGNLIALDAALADIKKQGVDQTICLGDIIFNGPQPKQALGRIRELGCLVVMGNTDEFFLNPPAANPKDEKDVVLLELIRWGLDQLTPDDLLFMKSFEPRIHIPLDGENSLLAFHGSPHSNRDVILSTTPDSELAAMLGDDRAAAMAGGHTHVPMLRRYHDTLIINPGSIGMPFHQRTAPNKEKDVRPPWAEYVILEADSQSVEFRRAHLDIGLLLQTAEKSGLPYFSRWAAPWRNH